MKQYQINKAYRALVKMNDMAFPARAAYRIYMLINELEPIYRAELELERRLLAKHNGEIDRNGDIIFTADSVEEEEQKRNAFYDDLNGMNQEEAHVTLEPIRLTWEELGDIKLSPAMIASLDGFVEFE